jgi:hypothetical protein
VKRGGLHERPGGSAGLSKTLVAALLLVEPVIAARADERRQHSGPAAADRPR